VRASLLARPDENAIPDFFYWAGIFTDDPVIQATVN
jgi:hypothetical protein